MTRVRASASASDSLVIVRRGPPFARGTFGRKRLERQHGDATKADGLDGGEMMASSGQPAKPVRPGHVARLTLAPIFFLVGVVHLTRPGFFAPMMPAIVPSPRLVILLTGAAEVAGAIGLFVPRVRPLAGIMLALYAVCVYPVNINHAVHDLSTGTGLGWAYHYPRLFAQPLICWWALVAGGVWRSPFARAS